MPQLAWPLLARTTTVNRSERMTDFEQHDFGRERRRWALSRQKLARQARYQQRTPKACRWLENRILDGLWKSDVAAHAFMRDLIAAIRQAWAEGRLAAFGDQNEEADIHLNAREKSDRQLSVVGEWERTFGSVSRTVSV